MHFTPREMKLIAGLRKQEHNWPRMRWIYLGMAVFFVMLTEWMITMMTSAIHARDLSSDDKAAIFTICWVDITLFGLFAGGFIGMAIKDWQGNVHRMLLLRMLDALEDKSS